MVMTLTIVIVALLLVSSLRQYARPVRVAALVRVVSLLALLALATPVATKAQDVPDAGPEIAVENTDGVPFNDRLIFSRIQNNPDGTRYDPPVTFGVHDTVTLRVRNVGTSTLTISSVSTTGGGDWQIVDAGDSSIAAGSSTNVVVKFVRQRNTSIGCATKCLRFGTLTIVSNDAAKPNLPVELAGFWQDVSEGGGDVEPTLEEVIQVFGYKTTLVGAGQQLYNKGQVVTSGEEVFSPYWQRADGSKPVSVRQLAAFHGNNNGQTETIRWHEEDSGTTNTIFTHAGSFGQTLLPPKSGSTTTPAAGTFTPTGRFGFQSGNEWSDPTRNDQSRDREMNCPATVHCGHHVRFWPARDRSGDIIPDTYLMAQDYANRNNAVNYDFQDNIYLVSNIKPAGATGSGTPEPALYRIDVAGIPFIDNTGAAWQSDRNLFLPTTLDAENPADPNNYANTLRIDNTTLDPIYRSYRGKTGTSNPTSFVLPTRGLTTVNLRLHFAERFWTQSGKRRFDVRAEGNTILNDFDIYAEAGAKNKAVIKEFSNIAVSDGTLNLDFQASIDNASIAAIEVLCPGTCPTSSDTTPPAAPVNLTATGTVSGVALNWNDNSEADLKGYNVYRSINGAGFTKINPSLIVKPTSQYNDTDAPVNVAATYYVKAVDNSNNESAASNTATGTRLPDVTPPAAPANLTATGSASGIALDWNNNSESDLAGYNVYRSESAAGPFAKINPALLTSSSYNDTSAVEAITYYYYVRAVDVSGNESAPSTTRNASRPNTTPPATPLELSALSRNDGILLDWLDNNESDLAGYNVYRSDSASGTFTKLNSSLLTASTYLDTGAPRNKVSYYRVEAVDTSGNKSGPATANATRPSLNAPAPPAASSRLIRLQGGAAVLDWGDSGESDLKGYNVYRSTSPSGPFQKLNATPLTASTFTDSALPAAPTLFYRIVAVDTSDLESAPLPTQLERGWVSLVIR